MKRLHVHVAVADVDQSIGFYTTLFAAAPTVLKDDYAKWMVDDPRVNFAISAGKHEIKGIEHLGIQVESKDELGEIYARLRAAERPVIEEGKTICCYARSEKSWTADPGGIVWETFFTDGESTIYSEGAEISALSPNAASGQCCTPDFAA